MKNRTILTLITLLLSLLFTVDTQAVPGLLNHQGMLTDADGIPLNGSYTMRFRLFDSENGGIQLWNAPDGETQSIEITDGVFNVRIGTLYPLGSSIFASDNVWLEIAVYNDDSAAWETLSPRQRAITSAYAFRAGNADALDGLLPDDFSPEGHDHDAHYVNEGQNNAITSAMITNSNVTASDLADGAALTEILDDDGSGSGLNADYLDGLNETAFFRLNQGETVTGRPAFNGGTSGSTAPFSVDSSFRITNLNADYLDGFQGSAFTLTSQDYGRSGVSGTLYEGTATLASKYVNETGDNMSSALGTTLSVTNSNSMGKAVAGYATSTGGSPVSHNYGGYFEAHGFAGRGVHGEASSAAGTGVYGYNTGGGTGVLGSSLSRGVYGFANGDAGKGVYGMATGDTAYGVHGYAIGTDGIGVYGQSDDHYGVYGYGAVRGVYGYATSQYGQGVYGHGNGINGTGGSFYASGSQGTGIYAYGPGYAGDFRGDVRIRSSSTSHDPIFLDPVEDSNGPAVKLKNSEGTVTIELDGGYAGLNGRVIADQLHIKGNVGIGTGVPSSSAMAVAGTILAEEVIVETGWADYVFKPGYQRMPLNEVAEFIERNGHLPDIPTEQEVKEKGIGLGEFQVALLRKVEELTLYIIDQKKEIESLKKQITLQKGSSQRLAQ